MYSHGRTLIDGLVLTWLWRHAQVYEQLSAKGVPTVCVLFEGEQHGFRRSANIRRALDSELQFYGSVFGFEPPMPEDHEDLPMGERVVVPLAVEDEAPAS